MVSRLTSDDNPPLANIGNILIYFSLSAISINFALSMDTCSFVKGVLNRAYVYFILTKIMFKLLSILYNRVTKGVSFFKITFYIDFNRFR